MTQDLASIPVRVGFTLRFEGSSLHGFGMIEQNDWASSRDLTQVEISTDKLEFEGSMNTLEMWIDRHQVQNNGGRFFVWLLEDEFVEEVSQ
jgi:hypothetical protein